jgi:hypothetical protein
MQKLVDQQTEATRATADAAKQLGRLFRTKRTEVGRRSEASVVKSSNTDFSEEIKSLMSKAESNIPEVMSLAEKTEKSGGSIQRTISEAIRVLSVDEQSNKSGDITEDIAGELSSTATENVETILEQDKSSSVSRMSNLESKKESAASSSSTSSSVSSERVTSSAESFSKFAGKLSDQNVQEQVIRLRHKQHMMTVKEKHLEDLFKLKMSKIDKESVGESAESIKTRKKKIILEFQQSKAECKLVKDGLKSEEKELLFVNAQRKKIDRKELKLLLQQQTTSDVDLTLSQSTSSLSASIKSVETENGRKKKVESEARKPDKSLSELKVVERHRSMSLGPTLKPPLSPKASTASRRRRHSSAESDDSFNVSQAETISDHSDTDIRISALQVKSFRSSLTFYILHFYLIVFDANITGFFYLSFFFKKVFYPNNLYVL